MCWEATAAWFQAKLLARNRVTITHPELRRYFMSICEAVRLDLPASTTGKGVEILVLDSGRADSNRGLDTKNDPTGRINTRCGYPDSVCRVQTRGELISEEEGVLPRQNQDLSRRPRGAPPDESLVETGSIARDERRHRWPIYRN